MSGNNNTYVYIITYNYIAKHSSKNCLKKQLLNYLTTSSSSSSSNKATII